VSSVATAAEPQLKSYFCNSVPLSRVSRILLTGNETSPPPKDAMLFCCALEIVGSVHAVLTTTAAIKW
jgi:hypothetical protein